MDAIVEPLQKLRLGDVAETLARWQADPEMHVCYLAEDPAAIASDLIELEPAGLDAALIARRGEEIVAFLAAEWDADPPRVWWHGPFVDPDIEDGSELADVLYQRLRLSLPRSVEQEEVAVDDRHTTVAGFAARHGFERVDNASSLLVLGAQIEIDTAALDVVAVAETDRAAVAALHDVAFPGTHSTGARIASGEHHQVLLVTRVSDRAVGYIACEHQSDGSGYIDYLAVDQRHRGAGLARALIVSAVKALRERGCATISLTVQESNAAARALYRSVGFTEERLLRAWRKGF